MPSSRRHPAGGALAVLCGLFVVAGLGCGARSDLETSGSNAGGAPAHASSSSSTGGHGGDVTASSTGGQGGQGGAPSTSSSSTNASSSNVTVSSSNVTVSSSNVTVSSSNVTVSVSSSSGTGGAPAATGCSDGTREGFVDEAEYPRIAACSGGWDVPGVHQATATHCGRLAGNSSANPNGSGCGALDLCASGFHVCRDANEVKIDSPTGCAGAAPRPNLFFATRQGSTGCRICTLGSNTDPMVCGGCTCADGCAANPGAANDVFGCGSIGDPVMTCGVLDRFSNDLCGSLGGPWRCGDADCDESNAVTKTGPGRGGVLCCAD